MAQAFDVVVVGAGICGLAHALAAVRRGLRVLVLDRDAQANGASIRNFGFITVTGQEEGDCWRRALRSRDVWVEAAAAAGIPILQRGLTVVVRRPEAVAVLEAFRARPMGEACDLLDEGEARSRFPMLAEAPRFAAALWSPHEVRVESREAIPRLAAWLETAHGVTIRRGVAVRGVEDGAVVTPDGRIEAGAVVVCPGDDFATLFSERLAAYGLTRCKLHMLRLAPPARPLDAAVMSDLGLVRYLGYSALPQAQALRARLQADQGAHLADGIHLIAVQSADGSLVVGDSHHYAPTPDPFAPETVDALILDEYRQVLGPAPHVVERWTGTYASAPDRLMLVDKPAPRVRLVVITSGTGASTSFAIGEEVIRDLFG